jgi:ABC-type polysaccharide/polyol phosphate export permease
MGVFAAPGTGIPRSIFLTFGLILYYTFSETINGITADSVRNSRYIVESGVPKMAIILSTTVEVAANLAIRTTVFLTLTAITYGLPPWSFVLLPLFAIPLILPGITLGLVLNLYSVLYQDLLNVVRTASFYLLFASGVFTTIPDEGNFFHLLRMSPIYQLISIGRNMALEADFTLWPQALLATVFCVAALPFALVAFYRAEKLVNSYL